MIFQQIRRSTSGACAWFMALGWLGLVAAGCANLNESKQNIARNQAQDVGPARQKRTEEVAKDFDRNRDNAQFEAAASCWQRGDVEGSKTMLTQLLERNPNYRRARYVLADIYLFNGDSKLAIEQLRKAIDSDPSDAMAHYALAQVLDASGERNDAISHYQKAAALDPKNEVYALSYNTAVAATMPGAQMKRTAPPELAQGSVAKPKVEVGVTITDQSAAPPSIDRLTAASNQQTAQLLSASKDLNQHQPPVKFAAVDDWVRPLDMGGNSAEKSQSVIAKPQSSEAGASPVVAGPVASRPVASATAGNTAPSIAALAPAAKAPNGSAVAASYAESMPKPGDPQNQQNPLARAVEALARGDTAGAIELATAGLAQAPKQPAPLYRVLGAAHYRRGEYQAAQIALAQALSLDKSDALSYFLMGSTLAKLGQSETAARCFAEAARLDPRYGS